MKEPKYVKVLRGAFLALALALLGLGATRVYTVYPDPNPKVELPPVSEPTFFDPNNPAPPKSPPPPPEPTEYQIGELKMVENTTFTGIFRTGDKLSFNYNPMQKRGKRGCPT